MPLHYMTVKELINVLKHFPEDTVVMHYNDLGECDGAIEEISLELPDMEGDTFDTPNYCNGDSVAIEYWGEHGIDKPILFLKGGSGVFK